MLRVDNISLKFKTFNLKNINFTINEKECFALLGPSGSGKSCIMKSIAGVYKITAGKVLLNDREIHKLPPETRNVGIVFQDNYLFPHLNVYANIAFGLAVKKVSPKEIDEKVKEFAALLKIDHLLNRNIKNLSGGEKQRISLARCMILNPEILLLDEPFSSLDRMIREELIYGFREIFKMKGMTILYVTHDQTEARILADRIGIIKDGEILQNDNVYHIFNKPNCKFVAEFVNIQNIYPVHNDDHNVEKKEISLNNFNIKYDTDWKKNGGNGIHFCVRPEFIKLYKTRPAGIEKNIYKGTVKQVWVVEPIIKTNIEVCGMTMSSIEIIGNDQGFSRKKDDEVFVHIPENYVHVFG